MKLKSPGGELDCIGQFQSDWLYQSNNGHETYSFRVFVVSINCNNLLGCSESEMIGLVKRIHQIDNVFGDLCLMKTEPVKLL